MWPRPWYRPLEEGEEGIDAATGSWDVDVRRPVCSVCSGRAAAPKYILLGRPRNVRPDGGSEGRLQRQHVDTMKTGSAKNKGEKKV